MTQKPMNILYCHSNAELYGSDYVLLNLLKSLDQTRYRPLVILPVQGPLCGELDKHSIPYLIYDLAVLRRSHMTPWGLPAFLWLFMRSVLFLRRCALENGIDVFHTNTAAIWSGGVAARWMGKKHVWQVMELIERPRIVSWLMRKMVGRFSDHVFCISDAVRKYFLAANPGMEGKFKTLYQGVDLAQYDPQRILGDGVRKKLELDPDTVLVMFAGRFNAWKGQDVLASAIPRVLGRKKSETKIHFVFLGSCFAGREEFQQQLEQQIAAMPEHAQRISLFGFQDNLPEWLAAADIFILPSKQPEPGATVTIAAMAMKKPIIGTNIGGTPEAVVDGVTGLLMPPDDVQALADKILTLAENPALRKRMGEEAFQRARQLFSNEHYCQTVTEAYEK